MVSRSQAHLVREDRAPSNDEAIIVVYGPNFTGLSVEGETLTRVAPTVAGLEGTTIAYQWFRGTSAIAGATGNTYVLTSDDVGERITLRAVLSNDNAPAKSTFSPASPVVVANAAPANTAVPTITGVAQVGETLTATPGTWTGTPTPALTYQWEADATNIVGATAATYEPVVGDVGKVITVTVTGTNNAGSDSATSAATAAVIAA